MKERTTPDSRNTPSTTNLEEEEIVDALGNDGNASMAEQIKRTNPGIKMMMMVMMMMMVVMMMMMMLYCLMNMKISAASGCRAV